jgi:hypothetical protein
MRRALFLLGPSLVLAGAVFACEDESGSGGGPSFGLDSGVSPFDGSSPGFEASIPDGGSPDAPPGPPQVTVTVTDKTGPSANVRVVFHDAAGAVLETKLTGADGKATSSGTLPAMASALVGNSSNRHIVTWTGLENGDDLAVRNDTNDEPLGRYDVQLLPFDGAFSYEALAGGCSNGDEDTTISLNLYRSCVGAQSSVLARARDANNIVLGHSFKKGNAVPTDGGAIAVATGTWQAGTDVTITATNIPDGAFANADLLEVADGHGYSAGERGFDGNSLTFTSATGFADALQANVSIFPESLGSRQVIAKRGLPTSTITIDGAQALPAITGTEISGTDARRPVLAWTSSSTAASDGGLVRVGFFGPEDANYDWTFVVAPGATTVTAPAMPPEAESFLPSAGDAGPTSFRDPEVVFVEADVLPSYTAFRRQQGALVSLEQSIGGFSFPAMPQNGTYRATSYVITR